MSSVSVSSYQWLDYYCIFQPLPSFLFLLPLLHCRREAFSSSLLQETPWASFWNSPQGWACLQFIPSRLEPGPWSWHCQGCLSWPTKGFVEGLSTPLSVWWLSVTGRSKGGAGEAADVTGGAASCILLSDAKHSFVHFYFWRVTLKMCPQCISNLYLKV